MNFSQTNGSSKLTRRDFVKATAVVQGAVMTAGFGNVYAAGSDVIRVGIIGCGGRGHHDMENILRCDDNIELVAMADVFQYQIDKTLKRLKDKFADKVKVTGGTCFTGFEGYKQLLKTDIDLVVLTCPPHFRPRHFKAAIEAGKHVFMEKPVAVDPVGARLVIDTAPIADAKKLTVVAGTQARRIKHRAEIVKRIRDGQIGDIVSGQAFRLGSAMRNWGPTVREAKWSDMEWQLKRWIFFDWLSGDFVTEMHVHELDVLNWAMDGPPEKCIAMGGRSARTEPRFGNAFDHMSAEYDYPSDVKAAYYGSQIDGGSGKCHVSIMGTKGIAFTDWSQSYIKGEKPFRSVEKTSNPKVSNPEVLQHMEQLNAIRKGLPLNEAKRIAESSLTAIMARMSAYTGRELSWKWLINASELKLGPEKYELGDLPDWPVAIPGKTKLI